MASSVVLTCRPRLSTAPATNRRGFLAALKAQLPGALRTLQQGNIPAQDLNQSAIGPGMAVFTSYSRVVEADGSDMTVRTALALINQVLSESLWEYEGDFDADTQFCVRWFDLHGWADATSGEADDASRAVNTSIAGLERSGVFKAVAGKARLLAPSEFPEGWDPLTDDRTSIWEATIHLAKAIDERGAGPAATLLQAISQRVELDAVKELAYLLYSISERRKWTAAALLFNGLITSWSDFDARARSAAVRSGSTQTTFTFDGAGE